MLFLQSRIVLIVVAISIIFSLSWSYACNETVCASIVSKCMLLGSCSCDLSTCSCCKDCFLCLSFLYDECCSCFDLCPKRNYTDIPLSKQSHIEDFEESFPELFQILTEEPDEHERWQSITYPIKISNQILNLQKEKNIEYYKEFADGKFNDSMKLSEMTVNCTVAFMTECKSWTKCKQSCQTMGASSYRWFHDGCCECIGNTCINYGIKQSNCSNCPKKQIIQEEYDDYGQDDDFNDFIDED